MSNCLKEQQQLVCKDVGLAVNTFERTNCSGIALRAMLGSFSLRILVPPVFLETLLSRNPFCVLL